MSKQKLTLVALDDEKEIVEVIGALATQAGFDTFVTTSPESFHDTVRARDPDVIVLDLQMPSLDGIEILRDLAEQSARAGVILVTGVDRRTLDAAEYYGTSKGLKVLDTVQKPFVPEELLETLSAVRATMAPLSAEDLEQAIASDELVIVYQPVAKRFSDGTWDINSMEALVRWNHPTRGVLAPEAFLSMGEEAGFGAAITDFVIQTALQELKVWQSNRLGLDLRINISASLITDREFPDRMENLLNEVEIDPESLTLEVNETALITQHPDMFDIMTRLKVKNMNLAIDDFGIGYSSLTQLVRTPFNEMKIDTSLIMRAPQSQEARIMVEALVELAHKLNLLACAEGVETKEALSFLDSIQCDFAQGYLISPPVKPGDVTAAIENWEYRQKPVRQASS